MAEAPTATTRRGRQRQPRKARSFSMTSRRHRRLPGPQPRVPRFIRRHLFHLMPRPQLHMLCRWARRARWCPLARYPPNVTTQASVWNQRLRSRRRRRPQRRRERHHRRRCRRRLRWRRCRRRSARPPLSRWVLETAPAVQSQARSCRSFERVRWAPSRKGKKWRARERHLRRG